MEFNGTILLENFGKWYELFKQSGGRFISNPIVVGEKMRIHYAFDNADDYNEFTQDNLRLTTPITETKRKYGVWNRLCKIVRGK